MTPDMLWPLPAQSRTPRIDPGALASRMNHPSMLAKRRRAKELRSARQEPRVILRANDRILDLSDCGNGCGQGTWCQACRADIRAEALHWLRELNVVRPSGGVANLSWSRAWNREILLADH